MIASDMRWRHSGVISKNRRNFLIRTRDQANDISTDIYRKCYIRFSPALAQGATQHEGRSGASQKGGGRDKKEPPPTGRHHTRDAAARVKRGDRETKRRDATRGLPRRSPILVLLSPKHA